MKIDLDLQEDLEFEANFPSGHKLTLDASEESGGNDKGPRPLEVMLSGLGGCTGIDVVLILKKMKAEIEEFHLDIDAQRAEEHPKRFEKIHLTYKFKGKNLSERRVERAISLSEDKYCSASSSLNAEITSSFEIEHTD